MNLGRHAPRLAAALALCLLALTPSATSFADTPPSAPGGDATNATGALGAPDPADPCGTGTKLGDEFVQSWALGPGGSLDPAQAGNRPTLSYETDPGTSITDAVNLFNCGNVPLVFHLYATDAITNASGKFDALPGGETPKDAGSWVTFAQQDIDLPPGKVAQVPISVTIPADASPGDHVGAVFASNVTEADNGGGQVVRLDRRAGTRLYIRVHGGLHPELAVTHLDTSYDQAVSPLGGTATVKFRLENRGNVRLSGTPTVKVSGPFGIGERTVSLPTVDELLPGNGVDLTATLQDAPALAMLTTEVSVASSGAADLGQITDVSVTDRSFTPPISLLVALLVLLVVLLAWRAFHRRRRDRRAALCVAAAMAAEDVAPAAAEELQTT